MTEKTNTETELDEMLELKEKIAPKLHIDEFKRTFKLAKQQTIKKVLEMLKKMKKALCPELVYETYEFNTAIFKKGADYIPQRQILEEIYKLKKQLEEL